MAILLCPTRRDWRLPLRGRDPLHDDVVGGDRLLAALAVRGPGGPPEMEDDPLAARVEQLPLRQSHVDGQDLAVGLRARDHTQGEGTVGVRRSETEGVASED